MAPSRKTSNGRSPLVNQQRQITAFFGKNPESSPSPSPSPVISKQKPNPKSSPSPTTSPVTPSPLQSKRKKPVLVIGPNLVTSSPAIPSSDKKSYGAEVVDRRIKVFWPLDKSWYEGCVKSFDKISGKHLVQYDDAEEEMINLSEEKIEWIEEQAKKKLRRLRRISVLEDDEEDEDDVKELEDDSDDEDWGKSTEKEATEDEDGLEDMDLELEEEESGGSVTKKMDSRKRKVNEEEQTGSMASKKNKIGGKSKNSVSKVPFAVNGEKLIEPTQRISADSGKVSLLDSPIVGDAAERFGTREAEKFRFLGVNRKDANGRRPGDVNYDSRTLYLPPDFVKGLTGGQRQWWDFKSKHMDKVLFFKMGKFYELYEMDAHIGAKELGLQYMKGEQPHCGFPEKNFSVNVEKLARKGYRVLVVEQTETPEQLEVRRREKGSKDKVVKREICAVVTKGTLTEGEMLSTNPDASYLMAVTESCQISTSQQGMHKFGICVVDIATSNIILGQFKDDADCSSLCCLLSELRPVEIIKPAKLLCPETEKALFRHTRNPLVNDLIPFSEFWNAEKTIREVMSIYQRIGNNSSYSSLKTTVQSSDSSLQNCGEKCLPDVLSNLVNAGENGSEALSALGGTLFYLKQAFLDESLLRFAKFELLPCSGFGEITQKSYMVLDAAAFENLEIFENSINGDSSGTLYAQLNHCTTAFGKRLLRTWLARPLYHLESIKERQDAIAELKGANQPYVLDFRKKLSGLPDMERLLARIFAGSEAIGRNANKVTLYEDASKKQLQEFVSALRGCETMIHACSSFGAILENVESKLLHHLLMPGTGIPDLHSILQHFKDAFDWEEANHSGRVIPREGADVEYDAACQIVKNIESNLTKHLKEQRKLLGDASICYVTIGKDAYLLEVPESLSRSIPKEYELRSSKKGFFRYWTPEIKKLLGELSQAESEKESKLKSILHRLIGRFCENHSKWRRIVSTIAELDVLISLSIASEYYEGKTCRPILSTSQPDEVPHLNAQSLGHPVLRSDTLGEGTFVTNDVTLGGSGQSSFILLTGPNMGGKSTLLRQICLAVILAQIGADVPAESFELSPIDRIFVRMGAKDQIMAGHSTFLTELLETSSMLTSATRSSLVALDELGRGTSTSDGQAIAASVLQHFVRSVQCRGMFSTHYHRLALDYQKDPKVSLCHMACQVGKATDGLEEVIFLYKLTAGACPRSYGVNVARLAGLPDKVLQKAAAKSQELEEILGTNYSTQRWEDKASLIIENLIKIAASNDHSNLIDSSFVGSLANLQYRARLLLEQC
ncbi:hypothetical protein BUALT_Bualt02G0241600 [Buddleja alternifolia]|uniref:DNA mismatch repair protein n=1 Tax=Buddleja alternifolia TaxID=168488 RepID=A0AAV6YAW1_9LAMI|nr:hypothetical protein BUALT_Bualt02G0241600 [Buddleja alternifolia]